ncbi:MAG: hypothetical protein AB1552_11365 [Nitrospirota bacterium]
MKSIDYRIVAARISPTLQGIIHKVPVDIKEIFEKPAYARTLLSNVCMKIFEGASTLRIVARSLDYLAYGHEVRKQSRGITQAIINAVGNQESGDIEKSLEQP